MKIQQLFGKLIKEKSPVSNVETGISPDVIKSYNKTRSVKDKSLLCHAPFSNMYFNTEGDVALCWKTFHKSEKYSESRTIMDIWQSANFKAIREDVRSCQLDFACGECKKHLLEGNYVNVLSKAYDIEHIDPVYPSIMEFELSNRCNLACTMCNGLLSSVIRKERDHLSPLKSPYGDKFVEELKEFIPHLQEARFNGGEPFLIKTYFQIWDEVFKLKPSLKMVVATNGTVLNDKVKNYLSKGNFHINLSMDGFSKEVYESIRLKGDHDVLMNNFEYFYQYCKSGNRTLCIMINPMRNNWWEMPDFVEFCNERNIHLWFNSIIKPAALSLWSLPSVELEKIYHQLSRHTFQTRLLGNNAIRQYNINTYKNLVEQQIKTWWKEALHRETAGKDSAFDRKASFEKLQSFQSKFPNKNWDLIFSKIDFLLHNIPEEHHYYLYRNIVLSEESLLLDTLENQSEEGLLDSFIQSMARY